jgi:alkylated DNA repair dioxygenase AlkB
LAPVTPVALPDGFLLLPDFLSSDEEGSLIGYIRGLRFGNVEMHGVTAKRRVAQFGRHYSFTSYKLAEAPPIPSEFDEIRRRAAEIAGVSREQFAEALVTEYAPGAGIGWHRDAPPFGIVAGISLGAACRMRFRRGEAGSRETAAAELPARSIYLLTGSARKDWQHTIPAVRATRWSITFRTLRRP